MTKRKGKKAAAALAPIIKSMGEKMGEMPPIQVLFKYDPEKLVNLLISYPEDRIFEILTDPAFGQRMSPDKARAYAKSLKKAVEKAINKEVEKAFPYYPLSREIINGTQNPYREITEAFKKAIYNPDPENIKIDSKGLTKAGRKIESVFLALHNRASAAAERAAADVKRQTETLPDENEATEPETTDNVKTARLESAFSESYFAGNLSAGQLEIPFTDSVSSIVKTGRSRIPARDVYAFYYGKKRLSKWDIEKVEKAIEDYQRVNFIHKIKARTDDGRTFEKSIVSPRIKIEPVEETTGGKKRVIFYDITLNAAFMMFKARGGYAKTPEHKHLILEAAAGSAQATTELHYDLFDELNAQRNFVKNDGDVVSHKLGLNRMAEKFGLREKLKHGHKNRTINAIVDVCSDLKRAGLLKDDVTPYDNGGDDIIFTFSIVREPVWIDCEKV